jgi:ABC-type iron transport system FetAB ATPase subunit
MYDIVAPGLISIPGMMTGQILGGSSVSDAAQYQVMIIYLIACSSFSTIFTQLFSMLRICFDSRMILRTDRLHKRKIEPSALVLLKQAYNATASYCWIPRKQAPRRSSSSLLLMEESKYLSPAGDIHIITSTEQKKEDNACLRVANLSYSFEKSEDIKGENRQQESPLAEAIPSRRILFQNISLEVQSGGKALVDGPSGVGKSTLLRILAGLTAPDEGTIELFGRKMSNFRDMSLWRRQVLYVPQTKVDIPGTPIDFMKKICSFRVRSHDEKSSTHSEMKTKTLQILSDWRMNVALLDSEWKLLSGGESQRVLLALALASCPRIILLDESTSAIDSGSKLGVETSVKQHCAESGMSAIWITHDQAQKERIVQVR